MHALALLGLPDEAEASCLLERRIDSVVEREGNTYWQLDAPIPSACRPSSGRVGYDVRAAREFSVSSDRRLYRVGPGERFGFGTSIGAREPIHLRFKDVESGNPCAPPEGLSRGETGTLQLLGANRISAGASWPSGVWKLNQSSDGIAFDIDLSLPSDLKVWRSEQYGNRCSDVTDRLESSDLLPSSLRGGHLGYGKPTRCVSKPGMVSRHEPLLVDPIIYATFARLMGIVLTNPSLGTIYATLY